MLFETLDPKEIGIDFFHNKNAYPFLSPELTIGSGVAMGDYDGDGLVDVFLPRSTDGGRLYHNLGNFHFEDVTEKAGIVSPKDRWTTGATFVDIDNDGRLDLFVCGFGCPNHLYINQGNGAFVERAHEYRLDCSRASVMMAFADYDRDGYLDAYLVTNRQPPDREISYKLEYDDLGVPHVPQRYLEYQDTIRLPDGRYKIVDTGQYDYLYHNNGDGTFSDVSETAGIRGKRANIRGNDRGLSATWWDYNNDGWPDLYVANDFYGADRLYRNDGNGTFTDVSAVVLPHTPWFSMGSDVGDINNDGLFDFMGTDMSERTDFRRKMTRRNPEISSWFLELLNPRQYMRNAVYLNTGADRFNEIAFITGMDSTNWTWSPRFVDLDQDGWVDVHVTNGMSLDLDNNDLKSDAGKTGPPDSEAYRRFWDTQPPLRERNFAFKNMGDLHFKDVSHQWGLDQKGVSFGAAFGDLDGDGDLDLVINNFQEMVTVARNDGTKGNAIRIRLKGTVSNSWGIGATVRLRIGKQLQARYLTLAEGFMSASDPTVHFGLGEAREIDELTVDWPSGQTQSFTKLPVNRFYTITEPTGPRKPPSREPPPKPPTLFAPSDVLAGLKHHETPYDDFKREPLLPARLSQLGPGLAVGDVNGDSREDLFLSGARGSFGSLMLSGGRGKWTFPEDLFPPWNTDAEYEQLGVLLFDADGDGDLDLFVASGSDEAPAGDQSFRNRLYLNDGQGVFTAAPDQVPDLHDSGSVVAAADYDRDGDLDLFVGGRCVPGQYPLTPHSRLLQNDHGTFRDVTERDAPALLNAGMVTSAVWSDVNGDGWIDLLVTTEWGPIKVFINHNGKLVDETAAAGLANLRGWWNGIAARDLDGDGDIDLVVTNMGRNTPYRVSADHPARIFYGDFNGDSKPVMVEGTYDEEGRLVPMRSKLEAQLALPFVEAAFPTFHEYASATLADVLGQKALDQAFEVTANTVDSVVLRNDGHAHFTAEPLPTLAQIAPGFGVVLSDFNADGITDAYIVQNSYAPRREVGRFDGGASVLLLGKEDGSFDAVPLAESGFVVPGDAKSVAVTDLNGDGWPDLVVGVNNSDALAFVNQQVPGRRLASVRLAGRPGNPTAIGARVTLERSDGRRQTAEVSAGGGYLSQQSPVLYFGLGADAKIAAVEVRWPDGQTTRQVPKAGELAITIAQPEVAPRQL